MFKPTQVTFSKASRLPLNSKKANRDFFKGTRTGNIMRRKLSLPLILVATNYTIRMETNDTGISRQNKSTKRGYPTTSTSRLAETKLRPYVFAGANSEGGVSRKGKFGLPEYPRMDQNGFDGRITGQ